LLEAQTLQACSLIVVINNLPSCDLGGLHHISLVLSTTITLGCDFDHGLLPLLFWL
jgi:hypothetical protein